MIYFIVKWANTLCEFFLVEYVVRVTTIMKIGIQIKMAVNYK